MSLWKKTGSYQIETYRRKTLWDRIKAFLDGLASICAVLMVLAVVIAIFE